MQRAVRGIENFALTSLGAFFLVCGLMAGILIVFGLFLVLKYGESYSKADHEKAESEEKTKPKRSSKNLPVPKHHPRKVKHQQISSTNEYPYLGPDEEIHLN